MQLKMRENSLFAVLLRTQWWYSMLIAAAIVLAAFALLRPEHAIYSIGIAAPFFGIAVYRAFIQMRSPSAGDYSKVDTAVRTMPLRELVAMLSTAYTENGYEVAPFKGKAADLRLEHNDRLRLVSCKRIKAANNGVPPLKELVAAGDKEEAAYLTFIALGDVSSEAAAFARENNVDIIGLEELTALIAKHVD